MRIKKIVNDLVSKYKTNNPFELCKHLGIYVIEEKLGTINGYFNEVLGIQFIHINSELYHDERRNFVVAHELGHAILHPNFNYNFLKTHTLYNVEKYEKEANKFAFYLIANKEMNLHSPEDYKAYLEWSENNGVSECS